jgi:glutamate-1-semialdehyde aminotransferase
MLPNRLADFFAAYTRRTARSREADRAGRRWHADARETAGSWPQLRYPIVADSSEGAHFRDIDGNDYVDLAMGFGAHLLGHRPATVVAALEAQLDEGIQLGPQSDRAGDVARLICRLTGVERVAFLNSGTEAVMTALRLARAVTGRRTVAMFAGSRHGTFDGTLASAADGALSGPPGTPYGMVEDVLLLDSGSPAVLQAVRERAADLAAVLLEPVPSRDPGAQDLDLLLELRAVTEAAGVALVFDETITGFRIAPGGAQEWAGVRADLVVYAGLLAAGLPIGVVAGSAAYLDAVDGGQWSFDGDSGPMVPQTMFAGTFSKHPLAMAATAAVLHRLEAEAGTLYRSLNERTARLVDQLNAAFAATGAPVVAAGFGSLFVLRVDAPAAVADLFRYRLIHAGVYVWEGGTCFLSTAHTDDDLDVVLRAAGAAAADLVRDGETTTGGDALPLTVGQRELWVATQLAPAANAYNEVLLLRLDGRVDQDRLHAALQMLVDRHDALRVGFDLLGTMQRISPAATVAFAVDSSTAGLDATARDVERYCQEPFDLTQGPLLRARLTSVTDLVHVFGLSVHHLVTDGWSFGVLLSELDLLYADPGSVLPAAGSYAEHVALMSEPDALARDTDYWQAQLPAPVPPPQLSVGAAPGAVGHLAREHDVRLEASQWATICAGAARVGCTPFVAGLTALHLLLADVSGQDEVAVAIHVAGQTLTADAAPLVGYFVNMLPAVLRLDRDRTCGDLLRAQRHALGGAYEHQRAAFGNSAARQPLTVAFNLDRVGDLRIGDLHVTPLGQRVVHRRWELSVNCVPYPRGCTVGFTYDTAISDTAVAGWADDFAWLLVRLTAVPDDRVDAVLADLATQRRRRHADTLRHGVQNARRRLAVRAADQQTGGGPG